nr:hypothetical protein CFP56_29130 [Quercus suber]
MPHSRIRLPKLIKQECRLENLKDVNFRVEIDEYFGSLEKLKWWSLLECKKLQSLPSQLRLLDTQSPSGLLIQVIDIVGILPHRVCETLEEDEASFECLVYISINGCEECIYWHSSLLDRISNILLLCSLRQRHLQQQLNESNPTDQNHVEVTYRTCFRSDSVHNFSAFEPPICYPIGRFGVHVECTCPPQESAIPNLPLLTAGHDDADVVDYMRELPFYGSDDKEEYQSPLVHDDDVDYWRELPFYGSDDKEEYQSPLVHDDPSMSCMSWLVGSTTKLFKLFCFCCPRDFS